MDPAALELTTEQLARLDRAGDEFLIAFFETERRLKPDDLCALVELGHLYTRLGRVAEGLAIDRELSARLPEDPTVHYNLACSLALSDAIDAAFLELARAVELGYRDSGHLAQDADLEKLRCDARFEALLARLSAL